CQTPPISTPMCGNAKLEANEQCDDGNLTDWDGCNHDCTASALAYIKASNTGAGDNFGSQVVMSADGMTLAVSAPSEDSAALGVDGIQTDDGAADSGAVYVFVRTGATWRQQAYLKASNTDAG